MERSLIKTATEAWLCVLDSLDCAPIVTVKGKLTREILNNSVSFDMNYPFIEHPKRKVNWRFLASEIYAICHGDNRVENLAKYNDNIAQFSDDEYIFNGAYGPPFNNQLMFVVGQLARDLNTRQAVLTIWKQNPVDSKDIRCTISLQFMVRQNLLHTFVNMRSSDAIWGLTYDFPVFSFMTYRVLTLLNSHFRETFTPIIQPGSLFWNAASSHIYEPHFMLQKEVLDWSREEELPKGNRVVAPFYTDWHAVTMWLHYMMEDGKRALSNM